MAFDQILNPIFSPLLKLPAWLVLALIACLMSFLITIIYKMMTNQQQMKELKDRMKELQKKMKAERKDTNKVLKLQKEAMESNMKYMVASLKPTLVTFIPVILIFGWLNSTMAYQPIKPDMTFTTTAIFGKGLTGVATITAPDRLTIISDAKQSIKDGAATWILKGSNGEYFLNFEYAQEKKQKNVVITEGKDYAPVEQRYTKSSFKTIRINNNPIRPFGNLSIFGWMPGWLGAYIIFSIASSMIFRKLLKVY
jgi:uncharacterized membrane protein (DUF106 family)